THGHGHRGLGPRRHEVACPRRRRGRERRDGRGVETVPFGAVGALDVRLWAHAGHRAAFFFSSRRRHTRFSRDWSSACALPIYAFNSNMPFDRFTVEQLAGDMLPGATLDQKIATGFNRNHRGNGEGGIVPEEYAVEYVVDRVDTTSTVWLGLTLGCARCHDHKYDPLSQKEFYKFFAYFNNVPERGMAFKYGNSPPFIQAPTPQQQAQIQELDRKVAAAEAKFAGLNSANAQREWEKSLDRTSELKWQIPEDLEAQQGPATFDGKNFVDAGNVA